MKFWCLVPIVVLLAFAGLVFFSTPSQANFTIHEPVSSHEIRLDPPRRFGLLPTSIDRVLAAIEKAKLKQDSPISCSRCLHLAHLFGRVANIYLESTETIDLVDLLCDSKKSEILLGDPSVVKTRYGVRFPTVPQYNYRNGFEGAESHRDQVLGVFAALGVSLSQKINLEEADFELKDVLRDSIANFHLGQQEISWSILAYSHYLPDDVGHWENRYGELFTFESVAGHLLQQGLGKECCGGTHRLFAANAIYKYRARFLEKPMLRQLQAFLEQHVKQAVKSQMPDGSWDSTWWKMASKISKTKASKLEKVVITSHLIEWFMGLPADLQPPESTYKSAGVWLLQTVEEAEDAEFEEYFCPYSHALFAIMTLSGIDFS